MDRKSLACQASTDNLHVLLSLHSQAHYARASGIGILKSFPAHVTTTAVWRESIRDYRVRMRRGTDCDGAEGGHPQTWRTEGTMGGGRGRAGRRQEVGVGGMWEETR